MVQLPGFDGKRSLLRALHVTEQEYPNNLPQFTEVLLLVVVQSRYVQLDENGWRKSSHFG